MTTDHTLKSLIVMPMSREDGIAICEWCYADPYHVYNWPTWDELIAQGREFADDTIRLAQYFSVMRDQQLVAFFQLFPLQEVIRLGLFVHPNWLNKGIGKQACQLAVRYIAEHMEADEIDLEVAVWNSRAIHVYNQCGFTIEDEYELPLAHSNKSEMVINMVYTKKTNEHDL